MAGKYCPTSDCYVAVDCHGRHGTKSMQIKFWWCSISMQYVRPFSTCKENGKEEYLLFLELELDLNEFQYFHGGNRTNNVGRCLHRKVSFTKLKAQSPYRKYQAKLPA